MQFRFDDRLTPLAYFASLVQSDDHLPLLEAAASLAQDEYPELDVQQVLGDVDQMLARLRRRFAADAPALQRLRMLNQFFYGELGFGGNFNHYYDPDNSHLNAVLRTRRGIPISLAVLWLELAHSIGLNACGVSFPGHFLVKVSLPKGQVVIDPLSGLSLSRESLAERIEPYQPSSPEGEPVDIPLGLYLQAAVPRDILVRMLHNLKDIHRSQQDWARMVQVQHRLIVLRPDSWTEYRDRGLAYAEQGHWQLALDDLAEYLNHAAEAEDAPDVAQRMAELRRAAL